MCCCDEEEEPRKQVEGEGKLRIMGIKLEPNYRESGTPCQGLSSLLSSHRARGLKQINTKSPPRTFHLVAPKCVICFSLDMSKQFISFLTENIQWFFEPKLKCFCVAEWQAMGKQGE